MRKEKITTENKGEIGLHFLVPTQLHEELRLMAFSSRKSIAQVCREAIEKILKENKKKDKSA